MLAPLTASPAVSADAPDLNYAKGVSWHLDGAPEVSAIEPTIRSILDRVHVTYAGVDAQQIEGFFPGPTYSYEKLLLNLLLLKGCRRSLRLEGKKTF